jgi:asparagine synthase (glutamine-hydrolysing)
VNEGRETVRRYWDFDPTRIIRYPSDADYESEFRHFLAASIKRRLRSDHPVLAELSGGLDSSSIVCMADVLIRSGVVNPPKLDTVSYYDTSEPSLDDHLYFARVEENRGRRGRHIDFSGRKFFDDPDVGAFTPFDMSSRSSQPGKELADCLTSGGYRTLLSGVGGDEVTGGVPTPVPELQDLIASGNWRSLPRQLKAWALNKRRPWFHLFWEAVREFGPVTLAGVSATHRSARWLDPGFVRRNQAALEGYPARVKCFGPLPSFQANLNALEVLRRQLSGQAPASAPPYEKRYPFLDRELLGFLFAVPREQILRPGQRRSLMRRSLEGIVPTEVLNRKRKAFVARAPLAAISNEWARVAELSQDMVSRSLGVLDQDSFLQSLWKAGEGQATNAQPLLRALYLEIWLRSIVQGGFLCGVEREHLTCRARVAPVFISAEKH